MAGRKYLLLKKKKKGVSNLWETKGVPPIPVNTVSLIKTPRIKIQNLNSESVKIIM